MDEKTIEELVAMILASGAIGSMSTASKKPDFEKFVAEAEEKRDNARKAAEQFATNEAKRKAKSAKMLFDAYVKEGFSEIQAFELLINSYK